MFVDQRSSGILLPVYALPGRGGVGTFGQEAFDFIDFLTAADQHVWQILPLGPSGRKYSPYKSRSAFAGDPVFISMKGLVAEGLLNDDELPGADIEQEKFMYGEVIERKFPSLEKAFKRSVNANDDHFIKQFERFDKLNAWWLDDHASFSVLADKFGTAEWLQWDKPYKNRDEKVMLRFRNEHRNKLKYQRFLQFIFFR